MGYTDIKYKFKSIGKNVEIGQNVYFRYPDKVEIGDNVIIDDFCFFSTSVKLGSNIHISPMCSIIGGRNSELIMGDYSGMAAGTRVICASDDFVNGPFTNPTIPIEFRPNCKISKVVFEKHTLSGTNTVIHPGVVLKEGSVTGSMTLVSKDLDEWGVYVGIPARRIKDRPKNYIKEYEQKYIDSLK